MPYKIEREGSKYKVVVRDTGRVVGTHPSKSQAEAQLGALYANVPEATEKITKSEGGYKPTSSMKSAARKAIKFKEDGKANGAGTNVGWTRAHQIVNGESLSLDTVKRMFSFFSRHEVDKKGQNWGSQSDPSNGYIMWLAWGGDAGFSWSRAIVNREKKIKKDWDGVFSPIEKQEVAKCMMCGCDDIGNDHHYISDVEKCLYCFVKGQGPCWDGYEYAGTKEQGGKTVPNCIPAKVKKESAGAERLSGGPGFKIEYNVPDCLGGYAVTKAGSGQVIGCYTTKEHAQAALDAVAVNEPDLTKVIDSADKDTVAFALQQGPQDDGDDEMNFWTGSFSPFVHRSVKGEPMAPTYNAPPQHDGEPSVGYGNRSDKHGRSNS